MLLLPLAVLVLAQDPPAPAPTLAEARRGFTTKLVEVHREGRPLAPPPPELFELVRYDAPSGPTQAYLSRFEPGEDLLPAIVWITGGFPAARGGSYVWERGEHDNEQSASAYRDAGIPMLFPTVRGTADNPGSQEMMMGEVDDVIAAARHLAGLEGVDPDRIYLGGHSTGATLALLVAESTDMFEGVFAFGPQAEFEGYGADEPWPFDGADPREWRLRSPLHFLDGIRTPTLVVEGEHGHDRAVRALDAATENPWVAFALVPGADHFASLDPVNRALARRVRGHREGPFRFGSGEAIGAYEAAVTARREARDLATAGRYFRGAVPLGRPVLVTFELVSGRAERLEACADALRRAGFEVVGPRAGAEDELVLEARRCLVFELPAIQRRSAAVAAAAAAARVEDRGWRLAELF